MRRDRLCVAAVLIALINVGSGCSGDDASAPIDTRTGKAVTAELHGDTVLSARRQDPLKHTVTIDAVDLDAPGYAGIYEDGDGAPGRLMASSDLLKKGHHEDVKVKLPTDFSGTSIFVVLHSEDNSNTTLDFPSNDAPVSGESGAAVVRVPLGT